MLLLYKKYYFSKKCFIRTLLVFTELLFVREYINFDTSSENIILDIYFYFVVQNFDGKIDFYKTPVGNVKLFS